MEKHTSKTESGHAATIDERSIPFKPRAALLLDVLPAASPKSTQVNPPAKPDESPQEMLQGLLMRTEASANRTKISRMKWQVAALVLVMLFVPAIAVTFWLQIQTASSGSQLASLEMENISLKNQINTAGLQITGLKSELDTQLNRNIELVGEIAKLKSLKHPLSPAPAVAVAAAAPVAVKTQKNPTPLISTKQPEIKSPALDTSRIEAIRNGKYPSGATRDELKTVLGEPDRIYKSARYEQWVYFGKKTARFWFIGNWLVQAQT
jgi:hypothetical protein